MDFIGIMAHMMWAKHKPQSDKPSCGVKGFTEHKNFL
jgi:hypothetical protein